MKLPAALTLLALASAPVAADAPSASGELADLFSRHGLRAVTPPVPAPDVDLPLVAGGRAALSDHLGDWVLLTFFATWCGPCRVEMPTLERLHRDRADAGLAVIGLSIDSAREVVAPFAAELDLTFPLLWDERGEGAAVYRADSIPLTYLIDPAGSVVAIARGARDWHALAPMLDAALAAAPEGIAAEAARGYVAGGLELPGVLDPPAAEVLLEEASPVAGESFHLDIRLRWAGDFEEYLPHTPEVHLPEGVERRGVAASSSSREGHNVVRYRVELAAAEPGSYDLDPVELLYTPRYEQSPVTRRVPGPTVVVGAGALAGRSPAALALAAGGVALVALIVLAVRRAVRAGAADVESPAAAHERLRRRLEEARGRRLQGDAAGFLGGLAEIERELGEGDEEEAAELARWLEAARYGGRMPPAEEMDRLQRRAERRLAASAPEAPSGRDALRLRETKS